MSAEADVVVQVPGSTESTDVADKPVVVESQDEVKTEGAADEIVDKAKPRNPVQPRIDELTRGKREAERVAEFYRLRAEAAEAVNAKPAAVRPVRPSRDDFASDEVYVKAYDDYEDSLIDWRAEQKLKSELDLREKSAKETWQKETRTSNWHERVAAAKSSLEDYDAVMKSADVALSAHVSEQLLDSEMGPQVAYHLALHPEILDQWNALSPTAAARAMGRLEAELETTSKTPVADEAIDAAPELSVKPRTSTAPPPVKPIAQGQSKVVDLSKLSGDDYMAARKAQGATWIRR